MLERSRLRRRDVECARDRDGQVLSAPAEHACELADATVGDGERRTVMTDIDDDLSARRGRRVGRRRLGQRAQHGERLEVDAGDGDARFLAGEDVAFDELPVGDDEQYAPNGLARLLVGGLREQLPVEHRLLERDRQCLLRTELDCIGELLRVVDTVDLEGPDADAVVGDAEPNALLRQLVLREHFLERLRERFDVAQLATDDNAVRERCTRDLVQLRRTAVVRDARGGNLRRADLEPDDAGLRDLLLLLARLLGGLGLLLFLEAFGCFGLAVELQLALPDRRLPFLRLADHRRLGRLLRRTAELQLPLPDRRLPFLRFLWLLRFLRLLRGLRLLRLLGLR